MHVIRRKPVGAAKQLDARPVLDELVRPADPLHDGRAIGLLEGLKDGASEAARQDVVLEGDDEGDHGRLAQEERPVEGADEARVDDADREVLLRLEPVGDPQGLPDHRAKRPEDDVGAFAHDLGVPDFKALGLVLHLHAGPGAPREADERG